MVHVEPLGGPEARRARQRIAFTLRDQSAGMAPHNGGHTPAHRFDGQPSDRRAVEPGQTPAPINPDPIPDPWASDL